MEYFRNCEISEGIVFPEGMQRVALGVEYDGAAYAGFQRQKTAANTVQAELEAMLTDIAQEPITLICAGRTDASVHATAQVVHFDTLAKRPLKAWMMGGNSKLPDSIRVTWAKNMKPNFHARFSAGSRTYRYVFSSSRIRSATLSGKISVTHYALNVNAMIEASKYLVGTHDFNALRAIRCQAKNAIRTIESINWYRQGELHVMEITANAFLYHMVRNIMGTLMLIGRGKHKPEWIKQVVASKDRAEAGMTACAQGLYLVGVNYPAHFELPECDKGPIFLGF